MIHVQVYTGAGNFRITDMSNAGKRGKRCPTISFCGWLPSGGDATHERIRDLTYSLIHWAGKLEPSAGFAEVAQHIRQQVTGAGLPEHAARFYEDEIRGIDAPRPKLTAGIAGKWSAGADESGICVRDLADHYNEWTEITSSRQTNAQAYAIAAKVWDRVAAAQSCGEASRILSDAGAKLHGYCAVD